MPRKRKDKQQQLNEPWNLPLEKASRKILVKLIKTYEKEGKVREAGICCSRMANLEKQIGSFEKSAAYGQEAVRLLRQSDDKKELARALRAACVPFMVGIDQLAYLRESLAMAREVGARAEEAATIFRFTRAFTPTANQMSELDKLDERDKAVRYRELKLEYEDGHTIEEALAIYEAINDRSGIAMCLVSLGVERKPSDRAVFDRAVKLYEEDGEVEAAKRAAMMADIFAPLPEPWDLPEEPDSINVLVALIDEYRAEKQKRKVGICLSRLSKLTALFGSVDSSKTAISFAREALRCFPRKQKGTEYCLALEIAAEVASDAVEQRSYLDELVSYAEEVGEPFILARAYLRLVTNFPVSKQTVSEALELFEDVKDADGIAACKEWMRKSRT